MIDALLSSWGSFLIAVLSGLVVYAVFGWLVLIGFVFGVAYCALIVRPMHQAKLSRETSSE